MTVLMILAGWIVLSFALAVAYSAGRNKNRRGLIFATVLTMLAAWIFVGLLTDRF